MRSFGQLWPTLKRLLAYGSPWRKPLSVAVLMLWIAAAAEVSGPLLISYFIDNMVAKDLLPWGKVIGLAAAYVAGSVILSLAGILLHAPGCLILALRLLRPPAPADGCA